MAQLVAHPGLGREDRQFKVFDSTISGCGAVGSASGLGPEGRQFESGHPDLKKSESENESGHSRSF